MSTQCFLSHMDYKERERQTERKRDRERQRERNHQRDRVTERERERLNNPYDCILDVTTCGNRETVLGDASFV